MENEAKAYAEASKIAQTMGSDGWKLIRQILEEHLLDMEKIGGISSLKELQAKQFSSKALRAWIADLDTISSAKEMYEKEEKVRKIREPIFRVVR
jgi:hypothetical protein